MSTQNMTKNISTILPQLEQSFLHPSTVLHHRHLIQTTCYNHLRLFLHIISRKEKTSSNRLGPPPPPPPPLSRGVEKLEGPSALQPTAESTCYNHQQSATEQLTTGIWNWISFLLFFSLRSWMLTVLSLSKNENNSSGMVARTDNRARVESLGLLGAVGTWAKFTHSNTQAGCFGRLLPYALIQ